jgi:tetratricopeptide (TPR) repeat protein
MLLSLAAVACAMLLLPAGWAGIRVTRILWPCYFSKQAVTSAETRIDALGEAIQLWPQAAFYQERGGVFQDLAGTTAGPGFREPAERAIADYQQGCRLHPYDPALAVNRAKMLSLLQRDAEAEDWFVRTIDLQGGMEPAFRGHFSLATHYLSKGLRQFQADNPEPAHATLQLAADHIEAAVSQMHGITVDMRSPRVSIHECLGNVREAMGDRHGALESYNFAATLFGGSRAHYLAGLLLEKIAVDAWMDRRPEVALSRFMEARVRILAAADLPQGATQNQRAEHRANIDRMIAFLRGAKVEPASKESLEN